MTYALVGTEGAVSIGTSGAALTPAWQGDNPRTAGDLLILRVTRKPDRVMAEVRMTDLKPTVARLTDFGLKTWLSERSKAEKSRVIPVRPPRDR